MPLALTGSLTAVQFRYPAELSLALNKIEHFSKVSRSCVFIEKFRVILFSYFVNMFTVLVVTSQ
jgi:hypothetical protein